MKITETQAKSILRKYPRIDSWFITRYGMNIYRGCTHNCVYCDGRAEKYQVEGNFGEEVTVKTNAVQLLEKELNPGKRSKPLSPCFMFLGGGVGDAYQPAEDKYKLARGTLTLFLKGKLPVHILTKSTLILRDLDLIQELHRANRIIVSFSFSSMDESISSQFEPGVPSPEDRLDTIRTLKASGIPCGIFLMPVLPCITDTQEQLERSIQTAREAGVDFIIFGGLTLKSGRQKEYFLKHLNNYYPDVIKKYNTIYQPNRWGGPVTKYADHIHNQFYQLAGKYKIPVRIPFKYFGDMLETKDKVIVMLEHLDYIMKLKGRSSSYGYAAYALTKRPESLVALKDKLTQIQGIGPFTEKIILEILQTGTSSYYQKMMG